MKTNKQTNKLSHFARLLLLCILAATLSNCQIEEELIQNKEQHSGADKSKISFKQFATETATRKFDPILKIKISSNIESKSNSKLSEFYIDTIAIKKLLSKSQQTTYTFRIYPLFKKNNPNEFYNLVYRKIDGNWTTSVFLLKKDLNTDKKMMRFTSIEKIGNDEMVALPKQKATMICLRFYPEIRCDGSCEGQTCDGFACKYGRCTIMTATLEFCGGSSGDSSSPIIYPTTEENPVGGGSPTDFSFSPNTLSNLDLNDPNFINEWHTINVWLNLDGEKVQFFRSSQENMNFFIQTIQYQIDNNWSQESETIANMARDLKHENPEVTWDQIENWFMGTPEGNDGEYNADFWENPNLTFPQQNLPTLAAFKSAVPPKYTEAGTLCNSLGGDVLKMYNAVIASGKKLNTCAIRVSTALIKCDIAIPFIPDNPDGSKNTVKDKDGNHLIINAKALNKWMRKTFGTNPLNYHHFTAAQGGTNGVKFPQLMEDLGGDGIYSMVSRTEIHRTWGTGHTDILEDGGCRIKCHFFDENNNFVPVDYIDVWILK